MYQSLLSSAFKFFELLYVTKRVCCLQKDRIFWDWSNLCASSSDDELHRSTGREQSCDLDFRESESKTAEEWEEARRKTQMTSTRCKSLPNMNEAVVGKREHIFFCNRWPTLYNYNFCTLTKAWLLYLGAKSFRAFVVCLLVTIYKFRHFYDLDKCKWKVESIHNTLASEVVDCICFGYLTFQIKNLLD